MWRFIYDVYLSLASDEPAASCRSRSVLVRPGIGILAIIGCITWSSFFILPMRTFAAIEDRPIRIHIRSIPPVVAGDQQIAVYRLFGSRNVALPIRVAIYDMKGHLIRKLTDSQQSPGNYVVTWNGKDNTGSKVKSGIYYCSVSSGEIRETVPVIQGGESSQGIVGGSTFQDGPYTFIGPEGGIIRSLAVSPSDPEIVYAGTEYFGGAYKSSDSGRSWSMISQGLTDFFWGDVPGVHSLAIDPEDPSRAYAGTSFGGLFRSTDGGEEWHSIGFQYGSVEALSINPLSRMTIYAGAGYSIYKSVDGGDFWTNVSLGLPPLGSIHEIQVNPGDTGQVLAATDSGLYGTTDGGDNWVRLEGGLPADTVLSISIVPGNQLTMYVGHLMSGVYKSTDGGDNWMPKNEGLEDSLGIIPPINSLVVDPIAPEWIFAGTEDAGVFRSTNGGASWASFNEGLSFDFREHPPINDLCFCGGVPFTLLAATGDIIFCASGIYSIQNKRETWISSNAGLTSTAPTHTEFDLSTPDQFFVGTRDNGIFRTTDGGETWTAVNEGITFPAIQDVEIDPKSPMTLYAGTGGLSEGDGIFKTTDGGDHWYPINNGLDTLVIFPLAIDPITTDTLYAGTEGSGIYRSTNGGVLWEEKNEGISDSMIGALTLDPNDHLNVYSGGWGEDVYRSEDAGEHWQSVSEGLPEYNMVTSLVIDATDSRILYLGNVSYNYNGVYKTTNSGDYWEAINNGLVDTSGAVPSINDLGIGPINPSVLYVGTGSPIRPLFRTTNGGDFWYPYALDLSPYSSVSSIDVDPFVPTILYTGMFPFGLVRIDDTQVGIGDDTKNDPATLPRSFSLSQNYPNPFNPSTMIQYDIAAASGTIPVEINIYDIRGRLIKKLVAEEKEPGSHSVNWDGHDSTGHRVSSGIYLYKMEIGRDIVSTKKMVLLK